MSVYGEPDPVTVVNTVIYGGPPLLAFAYESPTTGEVRIARAQTRTNTFEAVYELDHVNVVDLSERYANLPAATSDALLLLAYLGTGVA